MGFGSGADLLLSYLGDYGSSSFFLASVAISPLYDPQTNLCERNQHLSILNKPFHLLHLLREKWLLYKHSSSIAQGVDIYELGDTGSIPVGGKEVPPTESFQSAVVRPSAFKPIRLMVTDLAPCLYGRSLHTVVFRGVTVKTAWLMSWERRVRFPSKIVTHRSVAVITLGSLVERHGFDSCRRNQYYVHWELKIYFPVAIPVCIIYRGYVTRSHFINLTWNEFLFRSYDVLNHVETYFNRLSDRKSSRNRISNEQNV
ncbi:hypothetical protein GQR58_025957 [Nymphon striatum]|nr:hypothetical protein GQR58_025957 [Nymphon striatum]